MKSKSFHFTAGAAFSLMCAVIAAEPAPSKGAPPKGAPSNYSEVGSIVVAAAGEPLDPGHFEAKEKVKQLGDEAMPALTMMFDQAGTADFRAKIAGAMLYSKVDKKKAVDFLLPQVPMDPKDWSGKEMWITTCVVGICDADPQRGLPLARKAVTSTTGYVQAMAVRTLGKVGGEEEIKLLNEELDRHGRGTPQAGDNLPGRLRLAIEEISKRLEAAKTH